MKYYIYNPLSKNGETREFVKSKNLSNCYDSTNANEINELSLKLEANDTICIIGGDGSLHYIINNFPFVLNYNLEFYEYGSGNDFSQALENKEASYIYTINDNHKFINSFGIGFDALICYRVNKLKTKRKLSYIKEAYFSIKKYKPFNLSIEYNGKFHQYKNVWLCSLQNGPYFGGGVKIAKDADVSNEEVDLVIAHDLNFFKVLLLLFFVKIGQVHHFKKYIFTRKVKDVLIYNNDSFLSQLDGDTIEYKRNISISSIDKVKIKKIHNI